MPEPILGVKDLTTNIAIGGKSYPVVDRLSFDLHLGKTLALVGESGCGKSMTALSILRITPEPPCLPSTGEVIYRGKNLLALSEKEMRKLRGANIGMIFQDPSASLNPVYTVGYQLNETAELHLNLFGEEAEERALRALEEVGIPDPRLCLQSYPHQLSGGMKQRVMIAMVLMGEPDILIADEPTTALDVTIQAQVLRLMRHLQEKRGMAILLITHDMGVVAEMADDVIVMYGTQGVEGGSALAIFDRRAHPYTMGLFGSRPDPHLPRGSLNPIKGAVPPIDKFPHGCRFHTRCPYVMDVCLRGEVPDFEVAKGHFSKCWLSEKK